MPELPEVETLCRTLRHGSETSPSIEGEIIIDSQVLWSKTVTVPLPQEFPGRIKEQKIDNIDRRGKYLLFFLLCEML